MPLADCLKKVNLAPADVEALKAGVEARVAEGKERGQAEKEAVDALMAATIKGAESLRKQLSAPVIEIEAGVREEFQPPGVKIIGQPELGKTTKSRHQFYQSRAKSDKAIERQGRKIPELAESAFKQEDGRPVIFRLGDMSGSDQPHLVANGEGEPYFLTASESQVLRVDGPGALAEEAAAILRTEVGDTAFRSGLPIRDAFTRLSRSIGPAEAARKLLDAQQDISRFTASWTGADGRVHVVTDRAGLIDPVARATPEQAPLYQDERGKVTIVGDFYVVSLLPGQDLSTVLHETGHIFLEELRTLIATGAASPRTQEAFATLRDYLGNKGEPITIEQHEKFAVSFEAYLLEGRAPSAGLKKPFAAFRRWLTAIYEKAAPGDALAGLEAIAQQAVPGQTARLTPEVRDVFDSLLVLKPESEGAVDEAEFVPPGAEDAEVPEAIRARHQVRIKDLLDEATAEMEERLFSARMAEVAKNRGDWAAASEAALRREPVYQAIESLLSKPLDRTRVQSDYGDAAFKALSVKHGSLVTDSPDTEGANPDVVAAEYGFADGKALVDAIRKAPTLRRAIQVAVKGRVEEAMSAYGPADAIADTPEFAEVLEASRAYIMEVMGRPPASVDKKAIRRQAQQIITDMPLRQALGVDRFLQDMARLQRQERQAVLKRDYALAMEKNALARLQFELARESRKTRVKVDSIVARARRMADFDQEKIDYQYGANAVRTAGLYGLIPEKALEGRQPVAELLAALADPRNPAYEPTLDSTGLFPEWVVAGEFAGDFQALTFEQLEVVDSLIRFLEARGKHIKSGEILDGTITVNNAVAQLVGQMAELKDKRIFEEGTWLNRASTFADEVIAGLNIWLFRVQAIDGYTKGADKPGKAMEILYRPLSGAADARQVQFEKLTKLLKPHTDHIAKRVRALPKYVETGEQATPAMKAKGRNGFTFENVVAIALNLGNTYNAEAMARGLGFTLGDETPDVGRLRAMVSKVLTSADLAAVQAIWDTVNTLYSDLSTAFEARNGFPLSRVDAEAFSLQTADGQTTALRGGYYPVVFDRNLSERQQQQDAAEDLKTTVENMFPHPGVRSGMTKNRRGTGGKPLLMSLGGLGKHLADTVQFITHGQVIADVHRVTRHAAFKAAFVRKFGEPAHRSIARFLTDIGMPNTEPTGPIDAFFNNLKSMTTSWFLGANIRTALVQPVAIFNYVAEEGWATAFSGSMSTFSKGWTAAKDNMLRHPTMRELWTAADRDVADQIRNVDYLASPKLHVVQDAMFALIRGMDRPMLVQLWNGSYNKRLSMGQTDAEAMQGATEAILKSYPTAARAMDQGMFHRDRRGVIRLLTSFATAIFHFGNRQRFYFIGWRNGKVSGVDYFQHVVHEGILLPLVMQSMFDLLWGNFPPDDEDDWKRYGLSLFTHQFIGLPILKELINTAAYPGKGFGGNIPTFSEFDLGAKTGAATWNLITDMNGENAGKASIALADLMSFYFRVPASKVAEKFAEGWKQIDGFQNDEDALDYVSSTFHLLVPDPEKRK